MNNQDSSISNMMKFLAAAIDAAQKGKVIEFTCPLCGGKAQVQQSEYNGHHAARCSSCNANFIE